MNEFMKIAINEARKGIKNNHGGPFGCVITKDGKVIAKAHNCVVKHNDPTEHGEMNAIRKACKVLKTFDLSGCELYTTGYPCPMCLGAILWANISKVYYGCNVIDTNKIGFRDEKFYNFDDKAKEELIKELDRKACLRLYASYSTLVNKTAY